MRIYNKLRLKNVPWFRDQEFDLGRRGISVILGKNLNTPSASTNAAGKSYFFSHLPEVLLDEVPGDNRKDRTRKGTAEVEFKIGDHTYTVIKNFAKTSASRIEKDGVDLGIKDVAERKAYLAKLLARSPLEYQTLDYLDSTNIRNHPLVKGDTASRRNFFTTFFKLDDVDHFRKLIRDEISSVNEAAAVLSELQKQRKELVTAEEFDPAKAERALEKKRLVLEDTSKQLEGLAEAIQYAAYVVANRKELKLCAEHDEDLSSGRIDKELAKAIKILKRLEAFEEYQEEVKLWKASIKKRKAYLEEHPELEGTDEILKSSLLKAEAKLEAAEEANVVIEKTLLKHEAALDRAREKVEECKEALASLENSETCDRCGQPLNEKHLAKERKIAEAERAEAVKALRELKEVDLPEVRDTNRLKGIVKGLRDRIEAWRNVPQVGEKPVAPDDVPDVDPADVKDKVKELEQLQESYTQVCGNERFYKRYVKGIRPEKDVGSLQSKLLDTHSSLTKDIHELEFALSSYKDREKKLAKLKERIAELKGQVSDLEVLKVLEKAYASGTGSLKSLAIKTICDKLTQKTNQYARLIFPEDYHFSFDLDTQFHILVTRKYKGEEITSDVRKLSGAESSMFSLLLLIVLLTFIPKSRRSSLLVLDEPNANFGQEMTEALIRFLPVLNKVIPHIIVITPHSEHDYGESAKYFTVVKKGSKSWIEEGRT